jgi:Arc/MetJ family transcription regulator
VADTHIRVDESLIAAAREAAGLPHITLPSLVRLALAKLAGWPDAAALTAARTRATGGKG